MPALSLHQTRKHKHQRQLRDNQPKEGDFAGEDKHHQLRRIRRIPRDKRGKQQANRHPAVHLSHIRLQAATGLLHY
jgi:hypothetical protein